MACSEPGSCTRLASLPQHRHEPNASVGLSPGPRILAVSLMDGPLATMALAQVIAFMMFAFPRTPAAIVPALAAFPRPVPAPGAIGGRVGVWHRSLDEAARQDHQGHQDQDPSREPAHCWSSHGPP